jgi:quercetin dioxygenase-like cupin family protein
MVGPSSAGGSLLGRLESTSRAPACRFAEALNRDGALLMRPISTSIVVPPDGGEARHFLGTLATIKIDGEQTGGRYAIFESLLPHGAAPPLHSHPQDESFYVIEGTLSAWIDGVLQRCTAGSIAFFPGGTPHTFIVESESARVLVLSTPAGIERFVRALSVPTQERRLPDDASYPDTETIKAIFTKHDVAILGPPPTREDDRGGRSFGGSA